MPRRIIEVMELSHVGGVIEFQWVHLNLDYVVKAYRSRSFGYDCVVIKTAVVPDVICTAESYRTAVGQSPREFQQRVPE